MDAAAGKEDGRRGIFASRPIGHSPWTLSIGYFPLQFGHRGHFPT